MKNTLIPLDMIFVDASGRVTRFHSNAVPGDLTPIDGGAGVLAVLEINGGLARTSGERAGGRDAPSCLRHGAGLALRRIGAFQGTGTSLGRRGVGV